MKVFSSLDEDSWRYLEVMISLLENAPAMVRKRTEKFEALLVPPVLQMMTDREDDDKWSLSEEIAEDDTSDNNAIVESVLERLACGLGEKDFFPTLSFGIMLISLDWKQRHAPLYHLGRRRGNQMETMLENIMLCVYSLRNSSTNKYGSRWSTLVNFNDDCPKNI